MAYEDLPLEDNTAQMRLELQVAGSTAFIEYKLSHGLLFLIHTEVPSSLAGKGVGQAIVEKALQFAKNNGYKIVPHCPFVQRYLKSHPEWAEIIAHNADGFMKSP